MVIAWSTTDDAPEIIGDPRLVTDIRAADRALEFSRWLPSDQARAIAGAVEALRARGLGFAMMLTTQTHRLIEADGQVIGGRAVLRLRNVSGIRHELADLLVRHQKQIDEADALRTLVEAVDVPIWTRDEAAKLAFANQAYVRAVEARDAADMVERGLERYDRAARAGLLRAQEAARAAIRGRLQPSSPGSRRSFGVHSVPTGAAARGSASISPRRIGCAPISPV